MPPHASAVSVVIPVYNGADLIAGAIESVYQQRALPGEVIVVDDGSTDATTEVLSQFLDWPRFRVSRKENGGEASARNHGIAQTRGEYVAFLDHDDRWQPEKLERQLATFDPAWGMSFTAYERVSPACSEVLRFDRWDPDPKAVVNVLTNDNAIAPSTTLIRRRVLAAVEQFETARVGTDWLMWLRIAAAGFPIGYLPEPLTLYSWHGDNASNVNRATYYETACWVFDRYGDRRRLAWWWLNAALHAREVDDRTAARRMILRAARIHPPSIRPGWLRLL